MLPKYFLISDDGSLSDTRAPQWPTHPPIREIYCRTFSDIKNTLQLRATLRAGPYAWPGGYPLFFVTSDGAALSFESVRANYRQCAYSIRNRANDGWRIVGCSINYENPELRCEHSGESIDSAYGS